LLPRSNGQNELGAHAAIGFGAIALAIAVQEGDRAVGVLSVPALPVGLDDGQRSQLLALERSLFPFAEELAPQSTRLAIVKDQIVLPELAGEAEGQLLPINFALVDETAVAQVAPGDRTRLAGEPVVDDLLARLAWRAWSSQHIDRVSPSRAANVHPQNQLRWFHA